MEEEKVTINFCLMERTRTGRRTSVGHSCMFLMETDFVSLYGIGVQGTLP